MTTPKPIDLLTTEELRVEIAEAAGKCTCKEYDQPRGWETAVCKHCGVNPYFAEHNLPNYPTDANAALQLAHALAEKGWRMRAELYESKTFEIHFYRGLRGCAGWSCHEATATGPHAFALALCRAYLSVIRAGKEQQG